MDNRLWIVWHHTQSLWAQLTGGVIVCYLIELPAKAPARMPLNHTRIGSEAFGEGCAEGAFVS